MAAPSASARVDLPWLDPLRVLAGFAVVHHHVRGESLGGVGFGLPLFLLILFGLVAARADTPPLRDVLARRARLLGVPWLRWSLLYLLLYAAVDLARGDAPAERYAWEMVWYGGHRALWFLPFAVAALPVVELARRAVLRVPPLHAGLVAALAGALATQATAWALTKELADWPVRPWVRMAPALCYGLALGCSVRVADPRRRLVLLACTAALGLAAWLGSPWAAEAEAVPLRFAVALALACAGFAARAPLPRRLRAVSDVGFGVYLVHPALAQILARLADVRAWPPLLHAALVWLLAAGVVLALRRLGLRWSELRSTSRARPRTADLPRDGREVPRAA